MPLYGDAATASIRPEIKVRRDMRHRHVEAGAAIGAHGVTLARRHFDIDAVDIILEARIGAVARTRNVDLDFGRDAARIGGEQKHAVAHQNRFFDIVRDQDDRL